jgi:UDP-N-acetylmuramate--alanine ligase
MIQLADISRIYFIGIGGIGMSALARYFNHRGATVSGYDRTPTTLTGHLEAEGISIHFEDDISLLDKQAQLVVYTPAIPASHLQFQWYLQHQYPIVKRSDVLGIISDGSFNICIAGTHGKTSISTMVAHLLRHTGYGCNAFLGGVSANYGTNFLGFRKECLCDRSR